ncbi:MAG: hypothetical protein QOI64_90 [Solirubrobacteraceae bacterium]|jgi:hypothetical protein|nr:hypothetical protein [Solirubrobacteraceae bacterium]
MDRDLLPLDALALSDFDDAEAAGQELDAIIGGLGPVPGNSELVGEELDEESFDASILAALVSAR